MPITATPEDKQAYAKLGGAMDTFSDSFDFAEQALLVADKARDPMRNSGRLAKTVGRISAAEKAISYTRKVHEVLDEKTRDGGLLKLGVQLSVDIAEKLLGQSIKTHPYYVYHKAAIDALADTLNAARNSKAAVDSYRKAVGAATSQGLAAAFKKLESKKVRTSASYSEFSSTVGVASDIAYGRGSPDFLRRKIAQYGRSKLATAVTDLESWRAMWSGLAFEAMQLQIMAGNELKTAKRAMKKVEELISGLMRGKGVDRVGGYGATNHIEWEKYDRIVGQKQPAQALMDPVAYAEGAVAKANAWAQAFSEMCDFARGDQAVFPSKYNHQLDGLNKVLYG